MARDTSRSRRRGFRGRRRDTLLALLEAARGRSLGTVPDSGSIPARSYRQRRTSPLVATPRERRRGDFFRGLSVTRTFPLPTITPIAPTLAKPFHRPGWVWEEKLDGWRIVVYKDGQNVRLVSRTGRDHAKRFQEVAAAVAKLAPHTLILDTEVCVFDKNLVSQFHLLGDPGDELATPTLLMTFDCLYANGRDLRARPLHERREQLEQVVDGAALVFPVRRLGDDGFAAWDTVVERGFEGLVAKDPGASYAARARWYKVKVRQEGTYLVGGVTFHDERGAAIVVGEREGRRLRYRGFVEFGVGLRRLEPLITALPRIQRARSPFADFDARGFAWVAPRFAAELTYGEVMRGVLRDPVLRSVASVS